MRKLASVRKISNKFQIIGADKIEVVNVDGWSCVVKKDEFNVGDLVIYFEIDSWVPDKIAPFLSNGKEVKEFEGVKGQRLKSVKLLGQLSQGLVMPLDIVENYQSLNEGDDVTEILGILKWEPTDEFVHADALGKFPCFIPKTDEERVQNLVNEIESYRSQNLTFEITEKLDGSSMTVFTKFNDLGELELGVCSRSLELKDDGNTFFETAKRYNLLDVIKSYFGNKLIALQGELIGPKIQKNKYKLKKYQFRIFSIFDIKEGRYLKSNERLDFVRMFGLDHVDVIGFISTKSENFTVQNLLSLAEIKSSFGVIAEGIVLKCVENPSIHFKAISNLFLEKCDK